MTRFTPTIEASSLLLLPTFSKVKFTEMSLTPALMKAKLFAISLLLQTALSSRMISSLFILTMERRRFSSQRKVLSSLEVLRMTVWASENHWKEGHPITKSLKLIITLNLNHKILIFLSICFRMHSITSQSYLSYLLNLCFLCYLTHHFSLLKHWLFMIECFKDLLMSFLLFI